MLVLGRIALMPRWRCRVLSTSNWTDGDWGASEPVQCPRFISKKVLRVSHIIAEHQIQKQDVTQARHGWGGGQEPSRKCGVPLQMN